MAASAEIVDFAARSPGRAPRGDVELLDWQDPRLKLYAAGLGDDGISERLGLPVAEVEAWRLSVRLPHLTGRGRADPCEELRRRRVLEEQLDRGFNDAEAAERLELTIRTYRAWRSKRGVDWTANEPIDDEEERRRLRAFEVGLTDREAAARLGIPKGTYTTWRARRGLRKARSTLPPEEERRRLELIERGVTDEEAASRLGITRAAFTNWRLHRGEKRETMEPLSDDEEAARRRAWGRGLPDEAAAAEVGITPGAFRSWRMGEGLPGNFPTGSRPRLDEAEERRRRKAHGSGLVDAEAARELGLTLAAYRSWRIGRGLPANGGRLSDDEEARRRAAYEAGLTDAEAAEQLGIKRVTYRSWRFTRGLKRAT